MLVKLTRDMKALLTFIITTLGVVLAHLAYVIAANFYDSYLCEFFSRLVGDKICTTIGVVFSLWAAFFLVIVPIWFLIINVIWDFKRRKQINAAKAWDDVVRDIRNNRI